MEKWKITLSDESEIANLGLNGNNFISKKEITEDMFDGKLHSVTISNGEHEEIHEQMDLVQILKKEGEWWFILRDIPQAELQHIKDRADIEYIAMMSDIEL